MTAMSSRTFQEISFLPTRCFYSRLSAQKLDTTNPEMFPPTLWHLTLDWGGQFARTRSHIKRVMQIPVLISSCLLLGCWFNCCEIPDLIFYILHFSNFVCDGD